MPRSAQSCVARAWSSLPRRRCDLAPPPPRLCRAPPSLPPVLPCLRCCGCCWRALASLQPLTPVTRQDARLAREEAQRTRAQLAESEAARLAAVAQAAAQAQANHMLQQQLAETTAGFRQALETAAAILAQIDIAGAGVPDSWVAGVNDAGAAGGKAPARRRKYPGASSPANTCVPAITAVDQQQQGQVQDVASAKVQAAKQDAPAEEASAAPAQASTANASDSHAASAAEGAAAEPSKRRRTRRKPAADIDEAAAEKPKRSNAAGTGRRRGRPPKAKPAADLAAGNGMGADSV